MAEKNIYSESDNQSGIDDQQDRFQMPVMNQEMLYKVFSQVPAILSVVRGPEFICEFANEPFKQLVGQRKVFGKKIKEVLSAWDGREFLKELEKVYETNQHLFVKQVKIVFLRAGDQKDTFYLDINCQVYYDKEEEDKRIFIFAYDVTEQVKSRKLISLAEKKFRNLFFNIPVPLFTSDANGKILEFNDALVKFCGGEPDLENDIWCPFKNIYKPDGTSVAKENWKDFTNTMVGSHEGIELLVEHDDGRLKNIMLYPEFIFDENGELEGVINTIVDVTEQMHALRELEGVAKVIENLYLNAPAFICTLRGPEFIYELINPAYQKLFGKKKLTGKKFFDISPELHDQSFYKLLNYVYKTGKSFVGTEQSFLFSRDIDKEPCNSYLNFSLQPIYNNKNEISGLVIFGYDVTELVYSRQKGEENLKKILESLPQITSISSAEGTNIYFNNFFYGYSGLTEEEASVNGWNSILHPDERQEVLNEWEEAKKKKVDFHKELRLKRVSDGMYRWHIAHLTPVKNNKGEVMQWIASATDIHEQKWKEEKKDEFLSIASHELKTPLTSVKAYLQLIELSLENVSNDIKIFTQKAIISVDRLQDLISELLDVSKIQQQKLILNITDFDFDEMLKEVIESFKFAGNNHTIIKTGEEIHEIKGDKERIEQVVNNILSNAVKYSPRGGNILVKVLRLKDSLMMSVTDHGIGITSYNLEKIFERYFRAEGHDIHFQGLGIGLFISMEIIKKHGGKMWVTSTLGKGSTFSILIPMFND